MNVPMSIIIVTVLAAGTTTVGVLVGMSLHREATRVRRRYLARREQALLRREVRLELELGRADRAEV